MDDFHKTYKFKYLATRLRSFSCLFYEGQTQDVPQLPCTLSYPSMTGEQHLPFRELEHNQCLCCEVRSQEVQDMVQGLSNSFLWDLENGLLTFE